MNRSHSHSKDFEIKEMLGAGTYGKVVLCKYKANNKTFGLKASARAHAHAHIHTYAHTHTHTRGVISTYVHTHAYFQIRIHSQADEESRNVRLRFFDIFQR